MNTLNKINEHAESIIIKLKDGIHISKDEEKVLKIYNRLHAKASPLAGKRRRKNDKGGYYYK